GVVVGREGEKVFPSLRVADSRRAPVGLGGADRRRREDATFALFPRLADLRGRLAGLLSGGERQMLAIASALMCQPELLLIDELSLGLAPVVVEDLTVRLVQIRAQLGITIVIVEQSAAGAFQIADYGYVLRNGRSRLDGR